MESLKNGLVALLRLLHSGEPSKYHSASQRTVQAVSQKKCTALLRQP